MLLTTTKDLEALLINLLQRGINDGSFRADLDIPVAITGLGSVFTSGLLLDLVASRSLTQAADATKST